MANKTMTWGQFKAAVEAAGVKDSEKIAWVDWNGLGLNVGVNRYPDGGVRITHDEIADLFPSAPAKDDPPTEVVGG